MSVTTWRDEEAVVQWRNVTAHLSAQRAGRDKIFDDYRVRVTSVIRDYGLRDRDQAPYNEVVDGTRPTACPVA
ncbi:putative antibiotic biosynthesis monooxygenase [Pseudomonas putida S610]|nr:putative antibiotic biosynthesis monooxygenase [Pseudomonas putida S610]